MKALKITFWITTSLIFVFEGVLPALTTNSELAVEGIRHLQYPDYFRILLSVFKVTGTLVLILPFFSNTLKEWAYAGFTFTFISAAVSHAVIDGINGQTFFPIVVLGILMVSYYCHKKIQKAKNETKTA